MKGFVLVSVLCMVLGTSCAHTEQTTSEKKSPDVQEQPIALETTVFQEQYTLWGVQGIGLPLAEHRYLLARGGEQDIEIRKAEDFTPLVKEISSADQALEFVRLLSSPEIRSFLSDIYYSEVHKKEAPPAQEGKAETADEHAPEDRWFAIEAAQYDAWNLHEPVVEEVEGAYKIERFVASYPRREEQGLAPARLLKIWEWVDHAGSYRMEIQAILAEGEPIQKILLFQK
jgi:hypothetical protein